MKRLFWLIFGAVLAWIFARLQMDELYAEISRLRELERQKQENEDASD